MTGAHDMYIYGPLGLDGPNRGSLVIKRAELFDPGTNFVGYVVLYFRAWVGLLVEVSAEYRCR